MTTYRSGALAGLVAIVALAACSSTTSGSGQGGTSPKSTGASSADFPAESLTAPASSASVATSPSETGSPASSIHPAPSAPLQTATVHASDATYVIRIWADVKDGTCFDHAYGQPVITFLTQHPCTGLQRVLGTTTVNGRPVAFAESALGFRSPPADPYKYASEFSTLVRKDGTGNINDLLREGYRLPDGPPKVPYPDAFNCLGQDEGVTVWDAWYLDGPTPNNDKPLVRMTMDIFLQF